MSDVAEKEAADRVSRRAMDTCDNDPPGTPCYCNLFDRDPAKGPITCRRRVAAAREALNIHKQEQQK
jgi:hypothetical protein